VDKGFAQYQVSTKEENNRILKVSIGTFTKEEKITIRLAGKNVDVLGDWTHTAATWTFEPLIPLPTAKTYEIVKENLVIYQFHGTVQQLEPPQILAFYPSKDTVPENLLKCAIVFSNSMRDGFVYDYIHVLDHKKDTLPEIFLALEPALWNHDRTVLTLWIDPGRVKRDLLRNQHLGKPLEQGNEYTVIISKDWPNSNGEVLGSDFQKKLFIHERDEEIPLVDTWELSVPNLSKQRPLTIDFQESMDFVSHTERITVFKESKLITGVGELINQESGWRFTPDNPWEKGEYTIQLKASMEDLAGNNLIRPFDNDLLDASNKIKNPLTISFVIE